MTGDAHAMARRRQQVIRLDPDLIALPERLDEVVDKQALRARS